jgi:hypothetical protein
MKEEMPGLGAGADKSVRVVAAAWRNLVDRLIDGTRAKALATFPGHRRELGHENQEL